jgi:two-component system, OmpR family, phosphate regulon sensor histidine kinase PhoR
MSSRSTGRTPLALRFVWYGLIFLGLVALTGWFLTRSVESAFTEGQLNRVESTANIAAVGMPSDQADLDAWVEESSEVGGYRFTVIDADGVVLADSHADAATMENHADRPEVAVALAGGTGRDVRPSDTTGFEQLYVAVPAEEGGVLRLSASTGDIATETSPYRRSVIFASIIIGLLGLLLALWLARRLAQPINQLANETRALADEGGDHRVSRSSVQEIDELAIAITELDANTRARIADAERSSSTLEVVLEALPQGTVLLDEKDSVVYANPSAQTLLGAIPATLAGLVPFSFQDLVQAARDSEEQTTTIAEHGKPPRVLRGIATPFAGDGRVLLVAVDITERERAASVRRDFVANASHELKTPVSAIIASSEALQMAVQRGDASAVDFARQIEGSATQLDRLVADLLDLSRLERDEPELEPLSLGHLVREEVERVRHDAEERGIEVGVDLADVKVAGSRRDLAIAVRNLLDNAVRYTPIGGKIGAELEAVGDEAVLRVSDTGEGIPTRDVERVFERFYRVDNARSRATGGTGLGLAIVKHVVEGHRGSVMVESELGAGSVFTVRLPVLEEQTSADH